jgi:hypothetical protein
MNVMSAEHRVRKFDMKKMKTKTIEQTATPEAAAVAEPGAHVAPEKPATTKVATQKTGAHSGQKKAKTAATKTKAAPKKVGPKKGDKATRKASKPGTEIEAPAPRAESKGAKIMKLIARPKGATLGEIMASVGWQAHSVRGFLSTAGKKSGATIDSSRSEAGERVYKLTN